MSEVLGISPGQLVPSMSSCVQQQRHAESSCLLELQTMVFSAAEGHLRPQRGTAVDERDYRHSPEYKILICSFWNFPCISLSLQIALWINRCVQLLLERITGSGCADPAERRSRFSPVGLHVCISSVCLLSVSSCCSQSATAALNLGEAQR